MPASTDLGTWLDQLGFVDALWICSAAFGALTLVSIASGYAIERLFRAYPIYDVPLRPGQLRHELLGNLLWHLLWCPIVAWVVSHELLRFGEGWPRELATFFGCIAAFQLYYYWLHRVMHHQRMMFMHRWHHRSLVTTPLTGFSMHPLEGVGWVLGFLGPALLASLVVPIGAWGLLAFLAFAWFGNITGHTNVEWMPKPAATRGYSRVISNPITYHCLHHARFLGHYGFATSWADELFGTQFDDWMAATVRVRGGEPLHSLRERVGGDAAEGGGS